MGAVIRRIFQVGWLLGVLVLLALAVPANAAQRQPKKSPHGNLNIPCENCHTATSWAPIRAIPEFNHDTTRYPLRGMHEKVACTGCHVKPVFTDVGKDCASCHADFHRGQFGANCAQCHTVNGWQVSVQQISQHFNRFPLLGAHAVVQCDECHKNAAAGQYAGLSTDCETCHMSDFNAATNPAHKSNQSVFSPAACSTCHTSFDTWTSANGFLHDSTGFLLRDAHLTTPCASCHVGNNYNLAGIQNTDCGNSGCHLTTWQQTANPPHALNATWFPIQNCTQCHNPAPISWTGGTFPNHSATGFDLTQGHANLQCSQCHANNNYTLTTAPTDCASCHMDKWLATTTPVHKTSGAAFGAANCANCHTPAGWSGAAFDHSVTGFTLVGTHMSPTPTPCTSCHINSNYTLNSADCYGCHSTAYQSTTTLGGNVPNHVTANFPITASACAACHPITTWSAGTFDHTSFGFALTQGHANLQCTQCHINGNYALQIAATDCGNSQCHMTDWTNTNNPTHSSAGSAFAASLCSNCHTPAGWTSATFNHNNVTPPFPLTGAHTTTACALCHVNNNYNGTLATTCWGCHQTDYNGTANLGGSIPNHVTSNFPQDCTLCHTTTNWTSSTFNHNNTTFPLTGLHVSVACALCHVNNNYAGTLPTTCDGAGCHLATWQGTTAPPHQTVSATFPAFASSNCASCHTTSVAAFATATWDHGTTGFALTGFHTTMACALCHISNNYALPASTCWTCHQPDYNSTASLGGSIPNHVTASFPQDCTICHSTTNWTTSTFNHNTTTFPLTGAHATTVTCAQCHTDNYKGTLPITCDGCHDALYQSTATLGGSVPNHVSLAYPKTCDSCHNTTAWTGAVFNHNTTGFPLTGAHVNTACNLCHLTAAVPPTDCYSCHTANWTSTATLGGLIPNHVAAALIAGSGFSTSACATCHNTTAWTGATFTHSWFNQQHGNSGGVCTICHTSANDYTVFQCTGCHGNNNSANFNHPNVGGYVYNSVNCYACHSRG